MTHHSFTLPQPRVEEDWDRDGLPLPDLVTDGVGGSAREEESSRKRPTRRGSRGKGRNKQRINIVNTRRQVQPDDYESGNPAFWETDSMGEAGPPMPGRDAGETVPSRGDSERDRRFPPRTTGVLFGGLRIIPTHPCLDPPPRACFSCWQRGHKSRNCPRPTSVPLCRNCGRRGVEVTECPRCRERCADYLGG